MIMAGFNSLRILLTLGLCFYITFAPFLVRAKEEGTSAGTLSLADLQQLVTENGRVIRSFRLEGVVCAFEPSRRLVTLQDESATVLLELPAVDAEIHAGDQLSIEGKNCSLVRGSESIQIGTAPVVDDDGHHPALLKSGEIYLAAGFQPVRLAWFNGVGDAVLEVEWEGPGLQRQKVPDAVLWRKAQDPANQVGFEHGIDYESCNGDGNLVADFENGEPVARGVATNFEVSYRFRPEHTALFFDGFIKVPRAGDYTFYLTSDDGAQLRVGDPSFSVTRLLPERTFIPPPLTLNQTWASRSDSSWGELNGEVTFAAKNLDHLEIELVAGGIQVPVIVIGGAKLLSTNLVHNHIRVKGICEFSFDEKKIARVVVPDIAQVEILGTGNEELSTYSTNVLLTSVSQIQQLKPDQIAQKIPVRIKGVLIGMRNIALMLQDSTGGISVHYRPLDWTQQPHIGEILEVEGVTGPGLFAPVIMADKVRRLGMGPMPEPIQARWDQLMNGSLDCAYVEMQGILIAVSKQQLTLLSADGTVTVQLDGSETGNLNSLLPGFATNEQLLVGSLVRLRGCCLQDTDQQSRHVNRGRINLITPLISIEELAPSNPFSLPTTKIADLLWFNPRASVLHRTKLKGQILHARTGEYFAIEGQRGFRILTSQPTNLQAGDLIEAVGFPKLDGPSPTLQLAQIRKTGHASLPAPVQVSAGELLSRNNDTTLIKVEAVLVGETSRSRECILELQAGPRHFLAVQESARGSSSKLVPGSRLQLIGVYASADASRVETSTDPFTLLLIDGDGAIRVLESPSWWTAQHALIIAGLLAGALGLTFLWILLLHQKVEMRTVQLRKEIKERQRVEQAKAIEQERTRVAQDLHDELGAGLTTVAMLGSLVKNAATSPEKKTDYLDQIIRSAHSLVTALDEIVWAVNPQHNSIASSANYYAYFAQPFLNAAGIACRLEIAEHFSEQSLDPRLRHSIFLAFKEALNNIVRHSGATEVTIRILTAEEQLIIAVTDNGRGMDTATNQPESSHDGLGGMRDRLTLLGGSCLITSQKGLGTTVEFHIPFRLIRPYDNTDNSFPLESPIGNPEDKL